ncbi:predicted protein [Uncinocarpus reesii 1704]|uniref:SGNH hydrolase-type esterase domain-containing protein n=1 Tax=Uncinocarpus reesii (strain UAMH 1704) TaxID=336963 RepID=C4JZ76_UNCRE|nr:uncharacterized protein UREG_07477 [Uncinocarpus reesii 1704]EEP82612.1 predicted protein [Uncinocarpus reesii 1704]
MRWWCRLCIVPFLGQAVALPAEAKDPDLKDLPFFKDPFKPLFPFLQTLPFDPTDLSWIKKLAAIGDSYSAGIGAGDRLGNLFDVFNSQGDYACSRYDHAYPYLINNDPRLGDLKNRKFQFKSCSGAKSDDVLKKQIPSIDSGQQAILLSVGGNDVELVNILNQCIYQWGVVNKAQVAIAKAEALKKSQSDDGKFDWAKSFDWDALGRGCQGQLDHTQSLINSKAFSDKIDSVLKAAKAKLAKDGMIYVTGYGKFFGEKLTSECDKVSWSTWIYKSYNIFQPEAKLTKANRKKMNDLVDSVNNKLKESVKRAGKNVRPRLMFYELNTFDPLGTTPWKRSNGDAIMGTFSGSVNTFAEITLLLDPKAKIVHEKSVQADKPATGNSLGLENKLPIEDYIAVPNLLPDGIITNLVIHNMVNDYQKRKGHPSLPEVASFKTCPIEKVSPSLTVGKLSCSPERPKKLSFPVVSEGVSVNAEGACKKFAERGDISSDEKSWYYQRYFGSNPSWFNIGWAKGCKVPGDKQKQNMGDPLGNGKLKCEEIFVDKIFNACESLISFFFLFLSSPPNLFEPVLPGVLKTVC